MFLVTNFRTVIVLLCLATSSSSIPRSCWIVDQQNLQSGSVSFGIRYPCQNGDTKCGLDTSIGIGIGCVPNHTCPKGNYQQGQIVCDSRVCCCENDPPDDFWSCSYLVFEIYRKERCATPGLSDTKWCKPNIVCRNDNDDIITCTGGPVKTPYCKMEPGTGQGLGCGTIERDKDEEEGNKCPKTKYFGSDMVCSNDMCCCKGNDQEPCNVFNEQVCELYQFRRLKECRDFVPPPPPPDPNPPTFTDPVPEPPEPTPSLPPSPEPSKTPVKPIRPVHPYEPGEIHNCGPNGMYRCSSGTVDLIDLWLVMGISVLRLILVTYFQ